MGSQDTEITLGTGKMLVLFFGLVALCGVFFGLGFSLGRNSGRPTFASADATQTSGPGLRSSAMKTTTTAQPTQGEGLTFYKAVEQKDPNAQLAGNDAKKDAAAATQASAKATKDAAEESGAPDATTALAATSYFVQVAAVSKQDDAQALVDALKKKEYAAFTSSASTTDKLFHVQVGPFNDLKEAEATRAKLIGDGYNPILKK
jgi:septal ring-binding cell division protein DamX